MSKKNLSTAASNAADKFFTAKSTEVTAIAKDSNNSNITNTSYIEKHTYVSKPTNKSKHYDTRGKRSERHGILLDKQLKDDLQLLCNATNNRSLNDFIVTILLDYVEIPNNQEKLLAYKELLKL